MRRGTVWAVLTATGALAYMATGWVVVAPGEAAVVRRMGRVLPRPWTPGAHWGWPLGFDDVTRVRTDRVRRISVGRAGAPGAAEARDAGEFLTGDLNLLRAEATVQYRVSDPVAFALRSADVEPLLTRLTESSLSRAVARRGVDDALRTGRAAIARDVGEDLQRASGQLGLGISVLGVSLTEVRPPSEVAPDFAAAQAARSDRDRRINEARAYQAASMPAAKAAALARTEQARAYADRTEALARSRAGRFLALLAEADRSRPLTVRRLYLDAIRDLLPKVKRKLVMTPDEPVDLSILGVQE
jgi:membrane protease subunit HflK